MTKNESLLSLVENASNTVNFDASITKEDIISIALSNWEVDLKTRIKDKNSKYVSIKNEIKEIEKKVDKVCEQVGGNFMQRELKDLTSALSVFGWAPIITTEVDYPKNKEYGTVSVALSLNTSSGSFSSYSNSTYSQKVMVPDNVILYYEQLEQLFSDRDKVALELQDLRSELATSTSKEREARAQLARQILTSSTAGKNLLEKLES